MKRLAAAIGGWINHEPSLIIGALVAGLTAAQQASTGVHHVTWVAAVPAVAGAVIRFAVSPAQVQAVEADASKAAAFLAANPLATAAAHAVAPIVTAHSPLSLDELEQIGNALAEKMRETPSTATS